MLPSTRSFLEGWYSRRFGIDPEDVWCDLTVRSHTVLGDYPGLYVAWRADGVHVSAPVDFPASDAGALARHEIADLQDAAFWAGFAAERGLRVIGPATHSYLDVDPGPAPTVAQVDLAALVALRVTVAAEEWDESGFADSPSRVFGLHEDGVLVAAANLNDVDGLPRDIGVLVAPAARGRSLAVVVGRHAASYAISRHDFARWGAQHSNVASLTTASRLGFEPWCTQLAVR